MLEKQLLLDQCIIDCLKINYDITIVRLTLLPLGADVDAMVYKATSQDQLFFFVKLKRGHGFDVGTAIQTFLYNAGIKHIISPVTTIHGQVTQQLNEFTLIVYPFIEGKDGFSCDLTPHQWSTFGKTLRQIHEFYVPPFIKDYIKQETYSSQWRESVRSMYSLLDCDSSVDEISLLLLLFMKKHRESIQRLVDRAEQLAKQMQQQFNKFVLCHSDIHAGNVLLDNNGAFYIVDWDQPIMAPKERDLMFIGGGIANVWNKLFEQELFYKGYGDTEINMTALAYYRHERIVEDIAIYSKMLLLTTDGGSDRAEMYKHFIDMFEPRGVVEIAFETDVNR